MRGAKEKKTAYARSLRERSTDAETKLWNRLRARAINGHKFVRQEPVGPYIVDFICRERRVIIEVDGGQHATDPRDAVRDRWLTDHRYRVVRFWNNDVIGNIDGVLETIASTLDSETPPHPDRSRDPTSPRARGEVKEETSPTSSPRSPSSRSA